MIEENVSLNIDQKSEIKNAIIALLARREYSRLEIERKYRIKYDSAQLAEVLNHLQHEGWQSDQRCAAMLVRHSMSKSQGYLKLLQKAKEKGLHDSLIAEAIAEEEVDWYALAADAYQRKYSQPLMKDDFKERNKRLRFMLSRGFSYDQAQFALANCLAEEA